MALIIVSCVRPRWGNAAKTEIICTVEFEGLPPVEFNAMAMDREAHGKELHARLMAGEFGPIGPYVPPPVPATTGKTVSVGVIDP